jgi:8-oxo-dGTP pyrophosphatase MutT (NUDIX family)
MNNKKGNWTILSEKAIYDNPWINVTEFDVINPGGQSGIYGKVHFKNIAIGIIPVDEHGNIHLVGQFRFVLNKYSLEIPEGGGFLHTDPLESAKRELREETGLRAGKWEKILEMHLSNSVSDEFCIVYLATDLIKGEADPEDSEELDMVVLPFNEAYQKVINFEITDAISVAAILRLKTITNEKRIF